MLLNTTSCGGPGAACDTCCFPKQGGQFAVLNVLAELQHHTPGSAWYFNQTAGVAVFVPPPTNSTFSVVASELETLVSVGAAGPAQYVRFDGIHWRHARLVGLQLENCTGCVITGGSIANIGGMCANITGGSQSGVYNGTEVFGCGSGGIFLDGGNRTTLEPAGHAVEGALIHDWNRRVWCNAPGVMLVGVGCNVSSSELHSAPHMVPWDSCTSSACTHVRPWPCLFSSLQAVYAMGDEHSIVGNYFHEIVVHASDAGVTCAVLKCTRTPGNCALILLPLYSVECRCRSGLDLPWNPYHW